MTKAKSGGGAQETFCSYLYSSALSFSFLICKIKIILLRVWDKDLRTWNKVDEHKAHGMMPFAYRVSHYRHILTWYLKNRSLLKLAKLKVCLEERYREGLWIQLQGRKVSSQLEVPPAGILPVFLSLSLNPRCPISHLHSSLCISSILSFLSPDKLFLLI